MKQQLVTLSGKWVTETGSYYIEKLGHNIVVSVSVSTHRNETDRPRGTKLRLVSISELPKLYNYDPKLVSRSVSNRLTLHKRMNIKYHYGRKINYR